MHRLLSIAGLLLGLIAGLIALLGYLAYDVGTLSDDDARLPGLDAPASIRLDAYGAAHLEAASRADAFRALGYYHTRKRAWTMALFRQTALGRLSEWFGLATVPLDRGAHELGFGHKARLAYQALSDEPRGLLDAYAEGVNAALVTAELRHLDEFALLDLDPDPWEPWHALAVERLLAWLGTPTPEPPPLLAADSTAFRLLDQRRRLKTWLHVHDLEHSLAWAGRDTARAQLFHRIVTGSSALPLLEPVSLAWPGGAVGGLTYPGWPVFLVGFTSERSWVVLPGAAPVTLEAISDSAGTTRYGRILAGPEGVEVLARVRESEDALFFPPQAPALRDSGLSVVVQWPGLRLGTDWPAWLRLIDDDSTGTLSFRHIRGDGLVLDSSGVWSPLTPEARVDPVTNGVLSTRSPWREDLRLQINAGFAADTLGEALRTLPRNVQSSWAERIALMLVDSTRAVLAARNGPTEEALTLLENWDYRYDAASLGASVFETWVAQLDLPYDSLDSPAFWNRPQRYHLAAAALEAAAAALAGGYGDDPSGWRWEVVQPRRLFFPVWSDSTLVASGRAIRAGSRYDPLEYSTEGHPSTLPWHGTLTGRGPSAPSGWTGWIRTDGWPVLTLDARRELIRGFLGRYLDPALLADTHPVRFEPTAVRGAMTLHPDD